MVDILRAKHDRKLFAPFFRSPESWAAWDSFLAALFALPMSEAAIAIYRTCTGRTALPTAPAREAWLVCGRRSGKSYIAALIAVYIACFKDHRASLAPGETGVVMVLACDRNQARVILGYISAFFRDVPMLRRLVTREGSEEIELSNRITIAVHTSSFRSVRGRTIVAALCDEIAYWYSDDSANPDTEILNAIRPAMATVPDALLLCLSSPYARRGALWTAYRDHYAQNSAAAFVWQADTRTMNPTVPQSFIDAEYARDPSAAAAEYGAQFRSDVQAFLREEYIAAAIDEGVHELPRMLHLPNGTPAQHVAFTDSAGGSGKDHFTLAVARHEGDLLRLVSLRGTPPPFTPEAVVTEYAALLKSYGVTQVHGDRYAAEWVASAFRKAGIDYAPSERDKSRVYLECEPLFAQGRVRLLDHAHLHMELRQLERRTRAGGRDVVDHPSRAHDDYANAAAGALLLASLQARAGNALPVILHTVDRFAGYADDSHARAVPPWHL